MLSVAVVCDANPAVGYGHFKRCRALLSLILDGIDSSIVWLGRVDRELQSQLKNVVFENYDSPSVALAAVAELEGMIVIVDSYDAPVEWIDYCAARCKVLVLDDFGRSTFSSCAAVLNFTLNANRYDYQAKACFLGLDFFPCSPELEASWRFRERKVKKPMVLLCLGGSDRFGLTEILAIELARQNPEIRVVATGSKFYSPAPNLEIIEFQKSLVSLYADASVVVSGGGLIKYECAYLGIPNIVIAQNDAQFNESLSFESLGLCCVYGKAEIMSQAFEKSIQEFINWFGFWDWSEMANQALLSRDREFGSKSRTRNRVKLIQKCMLES